MAEYVRRRRPPANHPYWQHLHDRAHPPWVVIPVVIPTFIGLAIGLYAGFRQPYTMAEAMRVVCVGSASIALTAAVIATVSQLFDAVRLPSRRERWATAGIAGVCVGLAIFVVGFGAMFPFVAWYAACSGEGPWLGMLYGALIGGLPFVAIVYTYRQRWRARQRQWPRWERMRAPRTRGSLNLTELSSPPIPATPSPPEAVRPVRNPSGRGNDFNPPSPIGETGEET